MITLDTVQAHAAAHPRPVPNPARASMMQAIAVRVRDAKIEGLTVGRHRKGGAR